MDYYNAFYPFILSYATKDYIWGGEQLKLRWNKSSTSGSIAESWEMSTNEGGESFILNGEQKGQSLKSVLQKYPQLSGKAFGEVFPLLIKLIDAKTPLSVQVHPDDDYAMKNENKKGKNEMWYICEAKEHASIYLGLNKDISRAQLKEIITSGTIEEYLNKVPVKAGEYYMVAAGTLHAIGAGVTILEVQQNSDLTYRVYDYDRVDKDGQKRQLHIDKAMAVTDCNKYAVPQQNKEYIQEEGFSYRQLVESKHFFVEELVVEKEVWLLEKERFVGFTVVEGGGHMSGGSVYGAEIKKGGTVFVPADCAVSLYGKMKVIVYHT